MQFKQQPSDILKTLGMYEPEDIDLELIAYSLGAELKKEPLDNCEGNIIGTESKAIITLNESAHPKKQRFSLGHELGHWVNDRGKNLTYRCNANDMRQRSARKNDYKQNKEVRANQFSAELIMPSFIVQPHIEDRDINLGTVDFVSNLFNASRTSAAIRLVEISKLPCMIVCWNRQGKRNWFTRNEIVPEEVWPHKCIFNINDSFSPSDGKEVDADKWISTQGSEDYAVIESVFSNSYDFLSLIWWKDESPITSLQVT